MLKKLAVLTAVLLVSSGLLAQQIVTGQGYSVLYDNQGRCVFGISSAALPSNVVCQPGSILYRTDLVQFQTVSSGSWAAISLTADNISDGTIANADISATAAIDRSKLAEDALAVYQVRDIRNASFGAALTATEAAGTFNWTLGTNTIVLSGEVTDNETETSVGYFQVILPPEYVAAGDVRVRFRSALVATDTPTNNASTFDLSCYEQADGAVGSDLVATAAVTYAALDTFYDKDFTVTATGLVAGDILNCKMTAAIVDSEAGAGTITWTADPPKLLLDIKG